jgi:signal transduction histidine kinase
MTMAVNDMMSEPRRKGDSVSEVTRTEREAESSPVSGARGDPERAPGGDLAALVAQLRHEIELRDEFISTAAHELRNPLSPAYMQLEHMKETLRATPEPIARDWLEAQLDGMKLRFDRFLETLNRLLDASRLGTGDPVLVPEPCDLGEVTRAALHAAERELRAAGSVVTVDAPGPVTGAWDRLRLEQILGNLISNAARYGLGQPIDIAITEAADVAGLTVRDRGIGIADEDLPRIFQRFERARNVGRNQGFGLGLWIVAQLCRAMGGTIDVESELGRGTTFRVTLPRRR